jgi:hypothetical protein
MEDLNKIISSWEDLRVIRFIMLKTYPDFNHNKHIERDNDVQKNSEYQICIFQREYNFVKHVIIWI